MKSKIAGKSFLFFCTLRSKMIFSYSLLLLCAIFIIGIIVNTLINKSFEQYALNRQKKQIETIIDQVNQQYNTETGSYNIEGLEVIGNATLQNGFILHIKKANNEIHWDIQQHKAEECLFVLQHAETNMHSRYPNFQGGYTEDTYELKYNGETTGSLTIGYYGPYSLDDNELYLINLINKILLIIAAVFIIIANIIAGIMTSHITRPITAAISITKHIAQGNYRPPVQRRSSIREANDLLAAISAMSEKLETKEQQKRQMTADIAHELRSPLQNLQSQIDAIIDGIIAPDEQQLASCQEEIQRLIGIVKQLQELYVLENNPFELSKERFDCSPLAEQVYRKFESAAREKRITLRRYVPAPAPVCGDKTRIKQSMVNLIANAVAYTGEGGTVTLACKRMEGSIQISVTDTGRGISPEDLPHIFERFYRADKSRSHLSGGMGIGLAITKAIVEAHGGTITAESAAGQGSVFTVTLPVDNSHG
jgi:signal transduction histidine kinase